MPNIRQHPVELWDNAEFMEEVRQIVEVKYPEAPEHCSSLCAFMAQGQELARDHMLLGADPHQLYFLTMAHLFAMGYESALHDLATREHET